MDGLPPQTEMRDIPSTVTPGTGCWSVSVQRARGFAIAYGPETKDRAREVAIQWLKDNAR